MSPVIRWSSEQIWITDTSKCSLRNHEYRDYADLTKYVKPYVIVRCLAKYQKFKIAYFRATKIKSCLSKQRLHVFDQICETSPIEEYVALPWNLLLYIPSKDQSAIFLFYFFVFSLYNVDIKIQNTIFVSLK